MEQNATKNTKRKWKSTVMWETSTLINEAETRVKMKIIHLLQLRSSRKLFF